MLQGLRLWLLRILTKNSEQAGDSSLPTSDATAEVSANQAIPSASVDQPFPFDENLLERSRTQWQLGDWQSLAALSRETLQHHPDRAKLALLAATGKLQTGQDIEARQYIVLSRDWGVSNSAINELLVAGVYNTLGRASIIRNQQQKGIRHFETSIAVGMSNANTVSLVEARINNQIKQLEKNKFDSTQKKLKLLPKKYDEFKISPSNILSDLKTKTSLKFNSAYYWENRYQKGGNSGNGSYGRLSEFKAETINNFITKKNIKNTIEFGCGDGNQLSKIKIENYIGVDISPTAINQCRTRFKNERNKIFLTNAEFLIHPKTAELTLSLDVIFHLIEDEIFATYMDTLFISSQKFCIIYSSNDIDRHDPAIHVRHRTFTKWVEENKKDWQLIKIIPNKYPHDNSINPKDLSFSNFYFYEKLEK